MTYEEFAQRLVDCFHAGESSRFDAGDLLCELPEGTSMKAVASDMGRSASYLSSLRQVARTFPPEARAQDQTWSLHYLAARTSAPETWLERAIENAWSVRELRLALVDAGEVKDGEKKKVCQTCGATL